MISTRFTKFATASLAAAAIGLGALATAATASAETYQGGVIGVHNGGHTIVQAKGRCLNGSTQFHCGESQLDV
jgi:hypothetical protein